MLPLVGVWAPYLLNNLCGRIQGSSSSVFHLRVSGNDDVDEDLCLGRADGAGAEIGWVNLPCGHR